MADGDGVNTNTGDGSGGTGGERTFTQADVDRIVEQRLTRERNKYADYDELKSKAAEADKSKSDVQKLTEAVDQLKNDLGEERKQSKRSEVARRTGLSMAKVERLQGDSVDDMLADAEKVFDVKPEQGNESGKDGNTTTGDKSTDGGGKQDGGDAGKGGTDANKQSGGDDSARDALKDRSPEGLREGTVPNATGTESAEDLADQVWKKARGL